MQIAEIRGAVKPFQLPARLTL